MQNVMEFIKMIKMIQFDLQLIQTEFSKLWPEGQIMAMTFGYMLSVIVLLIQQSMNYDQDHMLFKTEDIYCLGPLQKMFANLCNRTCNYNKNTLLY